MSRRTHRGRHRLASRSAVPLPGLLVAGVLVGSAIAITANSGVKSSDLADAQYDQTTGRIDTPRSLDRGLAPWASPQSKLLPSPSAMIQPSPVAGLTQRQMNNARIIIEVGRSMGLPDRALIIAMATALQESNLHNYANEAVPASLRYAHEGTATDHDSVGLFQQRPSSGWGTVANLMRPAYQAEKFFSKLMKHDWRNMSLTQAAQAVQVSAYPNAYAKHEPRATLIVNAFPSARQQA